MLTYIHKHEFTTVIDGKQITYRKICFLSDKGYESFKCTSDLYNKHLSTGTKYTLYFDKFGRACEVV